MKPAVEFRDVDIVFGDDKAQALAMIDRDATRQEILEKTGTVLGCAGAGLTVNEGEISVLMASPVRASPLCCAPSTVSTRSRAAVWSCMTATGRPMSSPAATIS
jgi:hypothetical protein